MGFFIFFLLDQKFEMQIFCDTTENNVNGKKILTTQRKDLIIIVERNSDNIFNQT